MLRTLLQKKEQLRGLMAVLWEKREKGEDWTKEERADYDKHSAEVKKLNLDIKERSDYVESFHQNLPADQKEFKSLEKKASVFLILKRELFDATKDSRFKVDDGPIREVIAERSKTCDSQYLKAGETPVPLKDFGIQKRATIDTSAGSSKDLVEETIFPAIVPNLYQKAWAGRAGVDFVENWRGDFVLPAEDTKPASGFIAETADYPESSIDYKAAITLKPLKVGALQPFSLQSFMQDETRQLQNSINTQLMREWAKKVDDDFLNADGNPATEPKGILSVTGILEQDTEGNDGAALTFAKLIGAEGLLTEADQDMQPVWIVNSKTVTHARSTLRNNVAGSLYIGTTSRLADRRFVETNVVKSNLVKGASGATLSQAILLVPSSICVVQWAMPTIAIDRSIGFKSDTVWTKISGYANIGVKRATDIVNFKNIKTS